jgi:peptide/nickel transport system ATP-binding protein/oligopeptide transport system ATP-binding protein
MEKILEVKNLITSFHTKEGTFPAVNGVNFELSSGETLAIVGESGCGKSVTSLSIMQLLPERISQISPESQIIYKGEDISKYTNKQMVKIRGNEISMVFQDSLTSLNPTMTIMSQMMEPFMVHQGMKKSEAKEKVIEMLRKVGIPNPEVRAKQYPHELSGGMRQRVIIAMALSCDPAVLICDEPTTALDVTIQAQILRMINDLKKDLNTGVILITHDMGVVAEMADRVMVMYGGNAVEEADCYTLFTEPKHPYTKGLLASIPKINDDKRLATIEGTVPSLKNMPKGCRFCDRCEHCTDRCRAENPPYFNVGKSKVRCFLYENDAKEGK